ncbi:hypothetical protein A1D25_07065 [Ursidibacter arcticus]|nr:hypothetical protein A1D25_07065 [Ursidibacter arcticus]
MAETKAYVDLETSEVQAKAEAAREWCKYATDYALKNHSKRWHYLLIPHNEVIESKKLVDFLRFEKG